MATGIKRKDPPSSPSDESQSYITSARFIHRKWMRVPADQRALLEGDGSWAQNLRQGVYGAVNIPAKALQDVKGFRPGKQDPPASRPISSAASQALGTPSRRELAASRGGSPPAQPERPPASQLSWSLSPPAGNRRAPTSAPSSPGGSSSPSRSPSSHLKARPGARFLSDFPSSAAGDDDDLELEVPLALPSALKPAGGAALSSRPPVPTPPSAQVPIIPCTYNTHSSPEKRPAKRSRLAEPPEQDSSSSSEEESHEAQLVEPVHPAFTTLDPGLQSSNTSASTPSFLARASQEQSGQLLEPAVVFDSSLVSNSTPSFLKGVSQVDPSQASMPAAPREARGAQSPTKSQDSSPASNPPAAAGEPSVAGDEAEPRVDAHDASQNMERPGATVQDRPDGTSIASIGDDDVSPTVDPDHPFPFCHYSTIYQEGEVTPPYEGDKMNYVRACVNLKYIQKHHLLSSFLYDDFIRSFLDFITYVQETDEESPLEAHKWYNKTVDTPVYTRGVVTKHNLDKILARYPQEVAHVLGDASDVPLRSSGGQSQSVVPRVIKAEETAPEVVFLEAEVEAEAEDASEAEDEAMEAPEVPSHPDPISDHIEDADLKQEAVSDDEPEVAATQDIGVIATQPPITSPRVTQASPLLERTQRIPQTVLKARMPPPPPPTQREPPPQPRRTSTTPPTATAAASPPGSSRRGSAPAPPPPSAASPPGSAVSRPSSTRPSKLRYPDPDEWSREFAKSIKRRNRRQEREARGAASSIVSSSSTGRK